MDENTDFPIDLELYFNTEGHRPNAGELLSMLPLSVLILDEDFKILRLNRWAQQMIGPNDFWQGRPIEDLCYDRVDPTVVRHHLTAGIEAPLYLSIKDFRENAVEVRMYTTFLNHRHYLFFQDNPELQTLEEELRNFKIAINSADDAIFIFDYVGRIFYTNPSFEYQLGISYTQIIGSDVNRYWGDDLQDYHSLWNHIRNGNPWAGEIKCRRGDGSVFDVEVRITPIYDETKHVVAHICVQRNITQRKELEKQLEDYSQNLERKVGERTEALEKLHEISELFHSTDTLDKRIKLVLIAATAGETFRFNRAFLLLYNREKHELQGRAAIGPADPEEAGVIWQMVKSLPSDGTLSGAMQAYLNSAAHRDHYVNQIAERLTTSMDNENSILVKALKQDECLMVVRGSSEISFDRSIINMLGTDSFAVVPLTVSGSPIGVLLVDNAITHRTISPEDMTMLDILCNQAALAIAHAQTMEQLAQNVKELEAANEEIRRRQEQLIETSKFAALGQMAATVAHEIRTPLVAIGGFANMLLKKHNEEDADYNYINIIRDEALRLEDVLNRLLFYARPSTPQKVKNNLNDLINSVLHFIQSELNLYDVVAETKLQPNLPKFPFDRDLLRQVLINLLQNAIQSMENGGTLTIETYCDEHSVSLRVSDTGVGIAQENLDKIFEPFFSTKHAGTGLGLHVSQRIVEGHGGELQIDSELGEGTTVLIRFPRE